MVDPGGECWLKVEKYKQLIKQTKKVAASCKSFCRVSVKSDAVRQFFVIRMWGCTLTRLARNVSALPVSSSTSLTDVSLTVHRIPCDSGGGERGKGGRGKGEEPRSHQPLAGVQHSTRTGL